MGKCLVQAQGTQAGGITASFDTVLHEYCTKDLKTVCVYGLQIQVVSDMFSLFSALLWIKLSLIYIKSEVLACSSYTYTGLMFNIHVCHAGNLME